MKVNGIEYQTVWMEGGLVKMIDQNLLPFQFQIHECHNYLESCHAISSMIIRGAGAIGAAAGFAMAQAFIESDHAEDKLKFIKEARSAIEATRPTARNLFYAVEKVFDAGRISVEMAINEAFSIAKKDAADTRLIGKHGSELIEDKANILTHCNAGWLAFVDFGTALSPIYAARDQNKSVFVYVDETRPRGQGARLTAWELNNENIPHIIIPDNAAASLMASGKIDLVIAGADRIARNGDVANKIGTLDRAIIAHHFGIPFYIAAPLSTFDEHCRTGKDIVIEYRSPDEVLFQDGIDENGISRRIRIASPNSSAVNPAFDITPAELITGIITEKGIVKARTESISMLLTKIER